MYTFNSISNTIKMTLSTETEQRILSFVWNEKGFQIAKAILRKESTARFNSLPDFKLHYKATGTKTVWNWHKNRHMH